MNVFDDVDKFFASISEFLKYNYNYILIAFLLAFLFAFIVVLITTSCSYEAKLIKAIDMFNAHFMKDPQITTENLLAFNDKMKSKKVPKQLRKQWQQFVLYRDKRASEYMSFDICVSSPLKNSTYKRDVRILNFVAYILAMVSFITNLYFSTFESSIMVSSFAVILQHTLLCPILILVLNLLVTIYFDIRHNAIVNDINQNYQYFEVNIDKASTTIPEYVDYELLFDKNEIKHGIPVLYTYLQRRAEEEQRELERARIKNVKHEKFNFDEAGVAKSLVLERAMQEAENYIAERNKFLQDTEQVNGEITQEELNFREITKEYQREMQVSKEAFDDFKAQLKEADSSIQANYLKKQQQQELDRQRNLERDYDTATERHNQMMKTLQDELDSINDQLKQARTSLERGMMSEFDTYSQKVYADAERVVKERNSQDYKNKENEIIDLKNQIQSLTSLNEELIKNNPRSKKDEKDEDDSSSKGGMEYTSLNKPDDYVEVGKHKNKGNKKLTTEAKAEEQNTENSNETEQLNDYTSNNKNEYSFNLDNYNTTSEEKDYSSSAYASTDDYGSNSGVDEYSKVNSNQNNYSINETAEQENVMPSTAANVEEDYSKFENITNYIEQTSHNNILNSYQEELPKLENETETQTKNLPQQTNALIEKENETKTVDELKPAETEKVENLKPKKEVEEKPAKQEENKAANSINPSESEPKKRGRGRPRKVKTEEDKPKRKVGRPRKPIDESELNKPKRGRGRPRKDATIVTKIKTDTTEGGNVVNVYSVETSTSTEQAKPTTETKTNNSNGNVTTVVKHRGRPKKVTIVSVASGDDKKDEKDIYDNIDNYLKEIDQQIAEENAKMEESQKKLAKNSRIRRKR